MFMSAEIYNNAMTSVKNEFLPGKSVTLDRTEIFKAKQ